MPRAEKAAAVSELTEALRSATATVLTEYRGLSVAELRELRRALGAEARYAVVKNTLTRRAARDAGLTSLEPLLQGPSAIAFVTGDPVEAARRLRDFARAHPPLVVKGGVLEGRGLSADELRRLADLESREALLGRLAGGMQATLSRCAGVLAAPLSQLARLVSAFEQSREQGEPPAVSPDRTEDAPAPAHPTEPETTAVPAPAATDSPAAATDSPAAATDSPAADPAVPVEAAGAHQQAGQPTVAGAGSSGPPVAADPAVDGS